MNKPLDVLSSRRVCLSCTCSSVNSKLFFVPVLVVTLCRSSFSESVGGLKANLRLSYPYRQVNLSHSSLS